MKDNEFTCPKCLHKWEDNEEEPLTCGGDKTTTDCPECDEEIKIVFCTSYWFEQDETNFTKQYLKFRGYKGTPKSWYAVTCYMECFLEGKREQVDIWNDASWKDAYKIVSEFFDKEVIK